MGTIVANIEDDELLYSYQLCRDDDNGTYYLYVESSPLRGKKVFHQVEDLDEALRKMMSTIEHMEGMFA